MAFTLLGSTITQTGTDTDLSGISAVAGVTIVTAGSGADLLRVVNMNNLQLVVNGTLTMNSTSPELLVFGATSPEQPIVVNTGGTFTLGKRTTLNSTTRNEMHVGGIYSARRNSSHAFQGIRNNGGTINIFGRVAGNALPAYNQSGTWTFRDAVWSNRQTCTSNVASLLFMAGGTIDVDGLTLEGEVAFVRVLSGNVTQFKNVKTIQSKGIAQNENSTTPYIVNDYSPQGNIIDSSFWQGSPQIRGIKHLNSVVGTNQYCAGTDAPTATWGWVEFWKQINLRAQNPDNSPVSNAVVYVKDYNNGNRGAVSAVTGSGVTAGATVTARNTSILATDGIALGADRLYIRQTTSGLTGNFEVLLGTVHILQSGASTQPGYDVGSSRVDRRGKTDIQGSRNNTDAFDIHTWSYGNLYTKISDYSMLGAGVGLPIATMLLDNNVTLTEANAITKLASSFSVNTTTNTITVTANSTLDDLYDVMKVFKTRNVQAQLEYPSIGTQPVTASGDTLVTAMSVVGLEFLTAGTKFKKLEANATASGAFSNLTANGNVSQATPTNLLNVTITGTLTYNTNANIEITITNSTIDTVVNNGTGIVTINKVNSSIANYTDAEINFIDSTIAVIGADTVTFHPTANDRDLNINASGSFTSSYAFKFGSTINGSLMSDTLYLRCVAGGIPFDVNKAIVLGDNLVDLGQTAQLASISDKLSKVKNNTDLIPATL